LGGDFPFPIVLVPRYKLSLCHTPIKPDLLGFSGIGVFACGLRDHVITRFASKINWLRGVILLNPIVLVPWGRFSLCHTLITPILALRDQISILIVGSMTS
jgi:hypothetical protein